MTYRVAFTDPHLHTFAPDLARRLEACGAALDARRCASEQEVMDFCAGADAVIMTAAPITARVIGALTRCRAIVRTGTGYDTVDVRAAGAAGIPVANVPRFCAEDVADHTLGLLLACARHIARLDRAVRSGAWASAEAGPAWRLAGRCLGLAGFGRIGQAVARRAAAFGMEVAFHDPYCRDAPAAPPPRRCADLDDLLAIADVLSLHLPLTEQTRGMIGRAQFERMKPGAILLNTARGGLVVTNDLVGALRTGRLAAAGLDVLDTEPPRPDHPLLSMENVVITPHCAALTVNALRELHETVIAEVIRALRDEPLVNVVNREFLPQGTRERKGK